MTWNVKLHWVMSMQFERDERKFDFHDTMEPPLPYPANEPDLGNPQLALCIG